MRINFWLNGVKKEEEIRPDTLLLDFLRSLGCYSVKEAVRLLTVVFAPFWWREDLCFPVPFWQHVLTAKGL